MRILFRHLSGSRVGQEEAFDQDKVTIGRDQSNDLVFDMNADILCSGFHAEIRRSGVRLLVKDDGSRNGTFVNGERVTEAFIESGARIAFGHEGPEVEVFLLPAGVEPPPAPPDREMRVGPTVPHEAADGNPPSQPARGTLPRSSPTSDASPEDMPPLRILHLAGSGQGRTECLNGPEVSVGRNADCRLKFDEDLDLSVSGSHGRFYWEDGEWLYEDLGSQNGTFVNGQPQTRCAIADGDTIHFGLKGPRIRVSLPGGPGLAAVAQSGSLRVPGLTSIMQTNLMAGQEVPAHVREEEQARIPAQPIEEILRNGEVSIGRAEDQALCLPHPSVSREHALIRRTPEGFRIEDRDSTNGVYVNGERLAGPRLLQPGDRVHIGIYAMTFRDGLLAPTDEKGNIQVAADGVGLELWTRNEEGDRGERRMVLSDISLVIRPREFVAILGPSGAGKSLLMALLSGGRRPTCGRINYNTDNLFDNLDFYRRSIGYVPQQDIVHTELTVTSALTYAVRLRLPDDTTSADARELVHQTISRISLQEYAHKRISTLSGGQLKRVCLGVELIANPRLLFLDEVTSSQDAGTDFKLMELFCGLAAQGHTVICTTHNVEFVDQCKHVVLLDRGRMVFFGPPGDMKKHFGVSRVSQVYGKLTGDPGGRPDGLEESARAEDWEEKYRRGEWFERLVLNRAPARDDEADAPKKGRHRAAAVLRGLPVRAVRWALTFLRQFLTLTKRYVEVMCCDTRNSLLLIGQAPVIALIVGGVMGRGPVGADASLAEIVMHRCKLSFFLVLAAVWFGCSNAAREIVKERAIFIRERRVNMSVLAYVFSKAFPLALMCEVQCLMLLAIARLMTGMEGWFDRQFLALWVTAVASMLMGMLISAYATSEDRAITLVPLVLIPQVALSGAIVQLRGPWLLVARFLAPMYWAYDAMKITLANVMLPAGGWLIPMMHVARPGMRCDATGAPAVLDRIGDLRLDLLVLALFGLAFFILTALRLKSADFEST